MIEHHWIISPPQFFIISIKDDNRANIGFWAFHILFSEWKNDLKSLIFFQTTY